MKSAMKSVAAKIVLLILLAGTFALNGQDRKPVPAYVGLVNDFAGVLSPAEVAQLESQLKVFEDSTTNQIAVVTENGLGGRPAYDRAMDFARTWGIGSKENNNGVILYIAYSKNQEDRGYYTLVSQSLQGKLTDGVVGQIQRENLVPNLKTGNNFAAIQSTVSAYQLAIKGEFKAGSKKPKESVPGWVTIILILFLMAVISLINNSRFGRGYRRGGAYWFPTSHWGGNSGGWGGGGSGGGWGGFGGGGGFDGGGAGGNW